MQTTNQTFEINSLANLADIRKFIEKAAEKLGADREIAADLILATNEAITNTYVHGFNQTACTILVKVGFTESRLTVSLVDNGPPFDPTAASRPDVNAPLEARSPGGLGILMIQEYTDSLSYVRTSKNQNILTLQIGE